MALLRLPDELLLSFTSYLVLPRDLNFFAQTNARLYNLLNTYLYRRQQPRKSMAEGADVQLRSELYWTPLSGGALTAMRRYKAISHDEGSQTETLKPQGEETPLCLAAYRGHEDVVKRLLAAAGVNPSARTFTRRNTTVASGWEQSGNMVKLLLDRECIDPSENVKNSRGNINMLGRRQRPTRRSLTQESRDADGRTALSLAAERGFTDLVKLLLAVIGGQSRL
ncbi:hypothetical protein N7523_005791 [Penicillium sp. IBT 18751x]|nr:hypothetical protein N7523_005791 [Penicillium sp. IBT 18751x]